MRGPATVYVPAAPGGVREDLNPVGIPPGWLLGSNNWITTEDIGNPRPGYAQLDSQIAAQDRIIGLGFRGSDQDTDNVVIHSLTTAVHWDGSSQEDITGTWTQSTADQPVRFATMQSGGTVWLARVNELNAIDKWDGTTTDFQDVSAGFAARDVLVASGHLVLARTAENTIRWSDINDIDTYPSLTTNGAILDQTSGDIVAIRNISPLSFVVYKDDAVFLASRQAAIVAFDFQFISRVPGPISVNAIVEFPWGHVWLGTDNTFYMFDGARVKPLKNGRALASTLATNLHLSSRGRAHAMKRRPQQDEAWFFYPDASTGLVTRMASVVISDATSDEGQVVAINPHQVADEISASVSWRDRSDLTIDGLDAFAATIDDLDNVWSTIDAMTNLGGAVSLIGDASGNFYEFGRSIVTDDGTAIAWEFTEPPLALAGVESRFFFDGVESYWTKTASPLTVTIGATFTDSLSDAETETTGTYDLNTDSNHMTTFVNKRGKWVKVRQAGSSVVAGMEYRGMMPRAFPRGAV